MLRPLAPQGDPVEVVRAEREHRAPLPNLRELGAREDLHRNQAGVGRKIQLGGLREAREIGHDEHALFLVFPNEGENLGILRLEKLNAFRGRKLSSASARQ